MRALIKDKPVKGTTLTDLSLPQIGEDELLVRVHAAAICGTDIHIYQWNEYASSRIKLPLLFGHEYNEGQVWEAAENASHYRLDNLTAIVDSNKFQSTGAVEIKMDMLSLAEKFKAFGWETKEIDGNKMAEVVETLDWVLTVEGKPQAIIAHTIKGKGFHTLENTNCHFIKITDELLQEGLEFLGGQSNR